LSTASRICSADSTRVSSAAPGGVNAVGPLTRSTRAPRRSAASATAYPMRPLERLVSSARDRSFSRVGPAVIRNSFAGEILRTAPSASRTAATIGFVLGKAAGAGHATSQVSGAGFDDLHAALAKKFQIRLGRRMIPHVDVHRRSNDNRSGRGEIKRGKEVAGNALREMRQNISSGGSNQQGVNRLRDGNVLDGGVDIGRACSSPGENIPVITFSPESAAKVSGRTNSWAARVMMTCTRMPRSCSRRTISAAL
jgi:hypothetical protein